MAAVSGSGRRSYASLLTKPLNACASKCLAVLACRLSCCNNKHTLCVEGVELTCCVLCCMFVGCSCPQVPLVKLDDKHYKLVDQMERLTPRPPSLVAAKSLTVKVPGPCVSMRRKPHACCLHVVFCSCRSIAVTLVRQVHTLTQPPGGHCPCCYIFHHCRWVGSVCLCTLLFLRLSGGTHVTARSHSLTHHCCCNVWCSLQR